MDQTVMVSYLQLSLFFSKWKVNSKSARSFDFIVFHRIYKLQQRTTHNKHYRGCGSVVTLCDAGGNETPPGLTDQRSVWQHISIELVLSVNWPYAAAVRLSLSLLERHKHTGAQTVTWSTFMALWKVCACLLCSERDWEPLQGVCGGVSVRSCSLVVQWCFHKSQQQTTKPLHHNCVILNGWVSKK